VKGIVRYAMAQGKEEGKGWVFMREEVKGYIVR
jgi:hypothetical protein